MCNVLVVQTTRHAHDLAALTAVMEIPPGDDDKCVGRRPTE